MSNYKKKNKFQNSSKENRVSKEKAVPKNWYYMVPNEVSVSDLKAVLTEDENQSYDIEIWSEAGVLEIGYAEKASMDVEEVDLDLRDDYSNQYLAEHKIKSLFFVTLKPDDFETCSKIMKVLVEKLGGFFVGDTEDFTPVVS